MSEASHLDFPARVLLFLRRSALAKAVLLAALLFATPRHLTAAVVTSLEVQADTGLFQQSPDHNLGGMSYVPIGLNSLGNEGRGLFRFDVAGALPTSRAILDASLTLRVTQGKFISHLYHVHRLKVDWGEGEKVGGGDGAAGLGAPASEGEATWRARFHPQGLWSIPGGAAGVDFEAEVSASKSVGLDGPYAFAAPGLLADVRLWQREPASNYGWLVRIDPDTASFGSARRFATGADPARAPRLELIYALIPRIESASMAGNALRFEFIAQPQHTYAVQWQAGLGNSPWNPLTNLTGSPMPARVTIIDPNPGPRRFYRVGVQ